MTVFDTSALTRPLFTDADFTATNWDSAAEKAAFANALCRFTAADFREPLFTPEPSQTSAPILQPGAPPKTRRTAQQSGQTSLF